MKNFSNQRFPTDISFGSSGGPRYSTDILTSNNGKEYRNANFLTGRNYYNINQTICNKDQLLRLISFFRAMRGRAIAFRFKDWLDYSAQGQLIAIADGVTSEFQLIKTYAVDDIQEVRKITKPVKDTVKIYLNTSIAGDYMVDYDQGLINFNNPPPHGARITADFEFDIMVRFDIDQISAGLDGHEIHSLNDITLVEVI